MIKYHTSIQHDNSFLYRYYNLSSYFMLHFGYLNTTWAQIDLGYIFHNETLDEIT